MNNQLNRRIEQLESRIGVGKHQGATYIRIMPSLEHNGEEGEYHIHLAGELWATAVDSPFSPEQVFKLKTEYGKLTPEQLRAREVIPVTCIQVWPNGFELRTNIDLDLC